MTLLNLVRKNMYTIFCSFIKNWTISSKRKKSLESYAKSDFILIELQEFGDLITLLLFLLFYQIVTKEMIKQLFTRWFSVVKTQVKIFYANVWLIDFNAIVGILGVVTKNWL